MSAITHVGNKLLITAGKYRGCIGEIKEIKHLPCGLIDYVMIIDDSDEDTVNKLEITVRAEDCSEYTPGSINLENRFDITNYLSVNQMKDVAKTIYEKKIADYIDKFTNNNAIVSIMDRIVSAVANQYANDLGDKYKDDMLKIFKKVIESNSPLVDDEDEKCFGRAIQWALERYACKYIEEHPEEIIIIMKDEIAESARKMIDDKLSWSITDAINKTANEVIGRYFNPDLYK